MKIRGLLITTMLLAASLTATAGQLAGKNLILVQGFQLQHVFVSQTDDDGKRFAYNYWNRFGLYNNGNGAIRVANPTGLTLLDQNLPLLKDANGTTFNIYDTSHQAVFYNDPNAKILHFDSTHRLEEASGQGIGATIAQQLNSLFANDPTYCTRTNGCIVITHSTGDLVMQYVEENKASLLNSNARNAFDVTTYIDLAGARGGTEGAAILYELANYLDDLASSTVLSPEKQDEVDDINDWLNLFLGSNGVDYMAPGKQFQAGVLYDLQPQNARNTGLANPDGVPHLRVAGAGDEPYGFITHLFIKGHDDSVVPLHSSCGSSQAEAYDSCVWNRTLDGKVTMWADAPSSYYNYHYPFIQVENLRHNGQQWDDSGNRMAPLITDAQVGDVTIDVNTKTTWDIFLNKYVRIRDADDKTLAQVLASSLN
ncbi:hypothetical protein QQM79_05385 [Marinobacteraceae bacterium S3BR75-40.1]